MALVLRLCAYLTFALGFGLLSGALSGDLFRPGRLAHLALGLATTILAFYVLGPLLRGGAVAGLAAWFPILPLAIGLLWFAGVLQSTLGPASIFVIFFHALLGLMAVGLIEVQIGRRRRERELAQRK